MFLFSACWHCLTRRKRKGMKIIWLIFLNKKILLCFYWILYVRKYHINYCVVFFYPQIMIRSIFLFLDRTYVLQNSSVLSIWWVERKDFSLPFKLRVFNPWAACLSFNCWFLVFLFFLSFGPSVFHLFEALLFSGSDGSEWWWWQTVMVFVIYSKLS